MRCNWCNDKQSNENGRCIDCLSIEEIVIGSNRFMDLYTKYLIENELEESIENEVKFIERFNNIYQFTN